MARKARISNAIQRLMARGDRHAWTLEDLQAGLAGSGTAADFSSVFRAAERLVAEGVARKLLLVDGRARFELATAHHDHLHCTRCDRLVPIPCVIGGDTCSTLESEAGVAIREHSIVFSGLCQHCSEGAAPPANLG